MDLFITIHDEVIDNLIESIEISQQPQSVLPRYDGFPKSQVFQKKGNRVQRLGYQLKRNIKTIQSMHLVRFIALLVVCCAFFIQQASAGKKLSSCDKLGKKSCKENADCQWDRKINECLGGGIVEAAGWEMSGDKPPWLKALGEEE